MGAVANHTSIPPHAKNEAVPPSPGRTTAQLRWWRSSVTRPRPTSPCPHVGRRPKREVRAAAGERPGLRHGDRVDVAEIVAGGGELNRVRRVVIERDGHVEVRADETPNRRRPACRSCARRRCGGRGVRSLWSHRWGRRNWSRRGHRASPKTGGTQLRAGKPRPGNKVRAAAEG